MTAKCRQISVGIDDLDSFDLDSSECNFFNPTFLGPQDGPEARSFPAEPSEALPHNVLEAVVMMSGIDTASWR